MHSGVCLLVSRCRDSAVIQEQDEEEVKDSLLRGREGGEERSPEEEEDGEACPPLLPTPSIPQRLQNTLHNINLSIQQVSTNQSHLSPSGGVALVASEPEWGWDITHTCLSAQGKLLGVCGSVGSGKTSLVSAILGQVMSPFPAVAMVISVGCWPLSVHY